MRSSRFVAVVLVSYCRQIGAPYWASDETHVERDIAEMALAHKVGDETEQAYRRGNVLKKRRQLIPIRLRDVVRRHLRIGPAEHCHHLALGAVGVSRHLSAGLAYAMAALLRLVDAGHAQGFRTRNVVQFGF